MEQEFFLSGYCRAIDQCRMVEVEVSDGQTQADCAYPHCPHTPVCQIAQKIQEL